MTNYPEKKRNRGDETSLVINRGNFSGTQTEWVGSSERG